LPDDHLERHAFLQVAELGNGLEFAGRRGPVARIEEIQRRRHADGCRERGPESVCHPFQKRSPARMFGLRDEVVRRMHLIKNPEESFVGGMVPS
jgi:hypothetical protein